MYTGDKKLSSENCLPLFPALGRKKDTKKVGQRREKGYNKSAENIFKEAVFMAEIKLTDLTQNGG